MNTEVTEGTLPTLEPPKYEGWIANQFAMLRFGVDGVKHLAKEVRELAEKALETRIERGPEDYPERSEPPYIVREYHEGPRDNDSIKGWIVGCSITLFCTFVIGGWLLSNQFAADHAERLAWEKAQVQRTEADEKRLDNLEHHVYRGTDP